MSLEFCIHVYIFRGTWANWITIRAPYQNIESIGQIFHEEYLKGLRRLGGDNVGMREPFFR